MGQYESHEIIGEVILDTNNEDDRRLMQGDAGLPDDTLGIANFLDETLQELMASDVEEAAFNTADEDSFIHEYKKNNTQER